MELAMSSHRPWLLPGRDVLDGHRRTVTVVFARLGNARSARQLKLTVENATLGKVCWLE
jgi:hypothetical protein